MRLTKHRPTFQSRTFHTGGGISSQVCCSRLHPPRSSPLPITTAQTTLISKWAPLPEREMAGPKGCPRQWKGNKYCWPTSAKAAWSICSQPAISWPVTLVGFRPHVEPVNRWHGSKRISSLGFLKVFVLETFRPLSNVARNVVTSDGRQSASLIDLRQKAGRGKGEWSEEYGWSLERASIPSCRHLGLRCWLTSLQSRAVWRHLDWWVDWSVRPIE